MISFTARRHLYFCTHKQLIKGGTSLKKKKLMPTLIMRMQLVREKGIHVASPIEKIGMFLSFPIFIPVVASLSLSLSPDIASSTSFPSSCLFFIFIFFYFSLSFYSKPD